MSDENKQETYSLPEILGELNARIEKLENLSDFKKLEACILDGAQTHLSILKCESEFKKLRKEFEGKLDIDFEILKSVSDRVEKLEEHIKSMTEAYLKKIIKKAVPYKCPACTGFGSLKICKNTAEAPRKHFIKEDPCNSCDGKGIIWG